MQKHSRKQKRGKGTAVDANAHISATASEALESLTGFLDGRDDFASTYLRTEFLSKYNSPTGVTAEQRKSAAIQKWLGTEEVNARTNVRLREIDPGYNILPRVDYRSFLKFARRLLGDILGPLSNELVVGSFSGGASTSRSRTESLPAQKFVGMADVSKDAAPYVGVIHHEVELFRRHGIFYNLREVVGAKLFTVPKKSDIDRCACKEPDINMYLQKGVGRHIRRRLLRFGINLNDQSVNRNLARQGSIDSSIATIDLSSASDTVTIECVRALLPQDWFLYLNDIRSHWVEIPKVGTFRTEMFSSMGNGFTFELESLIFFVLMKTTAYFSGSQGIVSVYGDDLIIPNGMYEDASWILGEFGFTLNAEKSYHTGSFRESCGGHYYCGEDVTPFYLKRPPTHLTDVIRVGNQLRRWALADPCRQYLIPELHLVWKFIRDMVPRDLWGGHDLSVDTQLVTDDAPNNRLVRIKERRTIDDLGAYIAWHNTNWNRSFEPEVSGFEPATTVNRCRRRRTILGASTLSGGLFIEEITGMPILS